MKNKWVLFFVVLGSIGAVLVLIILAFDVVLVIGPGKFIRLRDVEATVARDCTKLKARILSLDEVVIFTGGQWCVMATCPMMGLGTVNDRNGMVARYRHKMVNSKFYGVVRIGGSK